MTTTINFLMNGRVCFQCPDCHKLVTLYYNPDTEYWTTSRKCKCNIQTEDPIGKYIKFYDRADIALARTEHLVTEQRKRYCSTCEKDRTVTVDMKQRVVCNFCASVLMHLM